jgi:hypothetical protein
MNISEDSECIICMQCDQKIINYSGQFCRKHFLSLSQINTCGNVKLDEFIKETQLNSKYCDDLVEWIPQSNLKNIKYLTNGGNSKVYSGTWNLLSNMSLASTNIALKAIKDFDSNINDNILNEVRKIFFKKVYIFS